MTAADAETTSRQFDLNIERVLESWTVVHALREVIANALDEAALTETAEPEIFRDAAGAWHVRDFGRGLRYEHFTQNESGEKHAHPELVVGKFGVGLKDALATFDRHDVAVTILSPHADITTALVAKHGFSDVRTLHAVVSAPSDPGRVGTDFVLTGASLTDDEIAAAKNLFLHYAGDEVLGSAPHGQVLRPPAEGQPRIFVNGLQVATDEGFLFSYNVTGTSKKLRDALNRERSNVGRAAYTDRVKAILLACTDDAVVDSLIEDLQRFASGGQHDETKWLDVGEHAVRLLAGRGGVMFVTAAEQRANPDLIGRAERDGITAIVVPDNLRKRLAGLTDSKGQPIRDLDRYRDEWNESFTFDLVDPAELTEDERGLWARADAILDAAGGRPRRLKELVVSETMRMDASGKSEAVGLWEPGLGRIVIKRSELSSLRSFAGTLLHEAAHARSGARDETLAFEDELTRVLGRLAETHLSTGP